MVMLSSAHGGDVWLVEKLLGISALRILDFSSNVNPYGPSPRAVRAIIDMLWMVNSYPDDESLRLKEKLAERYGLKPSNLIIGNGSTEIIYMFSLLFASNNPVGIHIPTFSEYERSVQVYGGECIFTRPHIHDQPSINEFVELMDRGARAIFICNPNNPNGVVMKSSEVEELLHEAEKRGVYVLLDEDFIELADEGCRSFISEVERFRNLVVLRSFTKSHGLAGLRIGYAASNSEIIEKFERIRVRWNVNLLAQQAALAAIDDEEHVEAARRLVKLEKPRLLHELERLGWLKPVYSHTNFLLVEVSKATSAQLKVELARRGILIRDCSNFRGLSNRYVRVAVRRPWENKILIRELEHLEPP